MTTLPDAATTLDALVEPVFIVRTDGTVAHANKSARSRFGDLAGRSIADLCGDEAERERVFIGRCRRSGGPVVGRMSLRSRSGQMTSFLAHGSRLRAGPAEAPPLVLIQLTAQPTAPFLNLTRQIRDLHAELRKRRRLQMSLEAALRDRALLFQELHHRVRNNLQLLLSMLSNARTSAAGTEAREALDRARNRVAAIGAAQRLLYGADLERFDTEAFIHEVCRAVMQTVGPDHEIVIEAVSAELSNDLAAPVGLVLNELLTNAAKHAFPNGRVGRVEISLYQADGDFVLTVADNGRGFDPSQVLQSASGLRLVRGLTRKLGGSLAVGSENGAVCTVRFKDPNQSRAATLSRDSDAADRAQSDTGSAGDAAAAETAPRG